MYYMKKHILLKAVLAAALFIIPFPQSASAEWINEELGPGAAVWVDETSPEGGSSSTSPVYEHSENIIIRVSPDGSQSNDPHTAAEPETQPGGQGASSSPQTDQTSTEAPSGEVPAEETPAVEKPAEEAASGQVPSEDSTASGDEAQLPANAVMSNGRLLYLDRPMIALTYDDGPNPKVGNRIMDQMAKHNGRATFFMVGNRVPSYASELQRMVAEGHEPANHSYSHKYLNKYDAQTIRAEVENCNTAIQNACGVRPKVMRLPGGNKNSTVLANVNMPIILWNIDTRDWDHKNAQKTINEVMSKVKDGDIILMHELYNATADASDYLIPTLTAKGYQLVTISELAQYKGVTLQPNKVYYSF